MTRFAVTGGTGFIGRHLLNSLGKEGSQVRALTRRPPGGRAHHDTVEWVTGNMADSGAWQRLVEPGCTVINLAYSYATVAKVAIDETRKMVDACVAGSVRRLVHCSTVSVYGRNEETRLTETSECKPLNEYGRIKLAVEQTLLERAAGRFEVVILRPTAVFGDGGQTMVKMLNDLLHGARLNNYLRSSLFGRRRTHLVPVETVVAALKYLSGIELASMNETFIVSDDDDPLNNFRDVETILMEELGISRYRIAAFHIPRQILELALALKGRASIDTLTEYRCDKLIRSGFQKPVSFEVALRRHIRQADDGRPQEAL